MPGKNKDWRFTTVGDDMVMLYRGEVVTDPNIMKKVALRCPRCGEGAEGYIIRGDGYIELWHKAKDNGKHRWCLGPAHPLLFRIISDLPHAQKINLTEEEKQAIYDVYIKRKKVSKKVQEKAKKALSKLLGGRKHE